MKNPRLSPEEFAEIWNTSNSAAEAQRRSGYKSVHSKASALRKQGWDLKHLPSLNLTRGTAEEEFIAAWNDSHSLYELTNRLNITFDSATSRACRLRARGIRLKKFPRRSSLRTWSYNYAKAGYTVRFDRDDQGHAFVIEDQDGVIVDWYRLGP